VPLPHAVGMPSASDDHLLYVAVCLPSGGLTMPT
jgi:hypothetical protein